MDQIKEQPGGSYEEQCDHVTKICYHPFPLACRSLAILLQHPSFCHYCFLLPHNVLFHDVLFHDALFRDLLFLGLLSHDEGMPSVPIIFSLVHIHFLIDLFEEGIEHFLCILMPDIADCQGDVLFGAISS